MTTMITSAPVRTIPALEAADRRGDLGAWDDCIGAMDVASRDGVGARREVDELGTILERIEASTVLRIEGPNADARKARLTSERADDARYCGVLADLRASRVWPADADRRVLVGRECCRLLRAARARSQRLGEAPGAIYESAKLGPASVGWDVARDGGRAEPARPIRRDGDDAGQPSRAALRPARPPPAGARPLPRYRRSGRCPSSPARPARRRRDAARPGSGVVAWWANAAAQDDRHPRRRAGWWAVQVRVRQTPAVVTFVRAD